MAFDAHAMVRTAVIEPEAELAASAEGIAGLPWAVVLAAWDWLENWT